MDHYSQFSQNQSILQDQSLPNQASQGQSFIQLCSLPRIKLTCDLGVTQQIYSHFQYMSKLNHRQVTNNEIQHSITPLLHPDSTPQQEPERNSLMRTLNIPTSNINREIQILAWRYKTSLPIVRPVEYSLYHNPHSASKNNNIPSSTSSNFFSNKTFQKQSTSQIDTQMHSPKDKETMCEIGIHIEDIKCRLSDMGMLPFSQILYLLKEMMIGYDVLIDKFGTFNPSESMVAVSMNLQWKMWINQDFFKNTKEDEKPAEIGEREFIYCLIVLAEKHCAVTSQSKTFFNDIKEYTYSKNCGFVKILQKIKEFSIANKIFQVNKIVLPLERPQKNNKEIKFHVSHHNSSKNISFNQSFNNNSNNNRPPSKIKVQKKHSIPQLASNLSPNSPNSGANLIKSSFQNFEHQNYKFFMPQIQTAPPTTQLQQCRSQKVINNSNFFFNPLHSQPQTPTQSQPQLISYCVSNSKQNQHRNQALPLNASYQIPSHFSNSKKKMGHSYAADQGQTKPQNSFISPQMRSKPQSPTAHHLQNKSNVFMNFAKSRQEIKNLVCQKTEIPSSRLLKPPQQKRLGKQRKYSQDSFKAKSVDELGIVAKKVYGSNIYEQDPEIKQHGVNVIKVNGHIKSINYSPAKKIINIVQDTNKQYSAEIKNVDCQTPNNSSNSTQQLQNSRGKATKKISNYELLKVNDLNKGKTRNNQSSYYGMGGYTEEQKKQKNMVVSCSFRNRDQDSQKSESIQKKERAMDNNWTKKISGLFSDDASIKHLKGSVKFKTNQQERFEKQYLKDVKLEMLQKFGRPVRHSIVDEDQEAGLQSKNPYKSMQLIQQVMDQGKSYVEKDEKQEDAQEQMPAVRSRHQTVQVRNYKRQDEKTVNFSHRECVSYECSEDDSEKKSSNQGQRQVINKR